MYIDYTKKNMEYIYDTISNNSENRPPPRVLARVALRLWRDRGDIYIYIYIYTHTYTYIYI